MNNILRWTWELPQTLLGLCLLPFYKKTLLRIVKYRDQKIYIYDKFPGGISLGYYVLVDYNRRWIDNSSSLAQAYRMKLKDSINHESGHGIQSRMFGPFYLLTVGLVSAGWNVLRRISKKYKAMDYYSIWPERAADKLGGVIRNG